MLILAIEPDKRQAAQVKAIVHSRLGAELILADSADHALKMLGDRVPDLILATALLSPKDETALNDRLRALERAALFVQTLTIPMLAAPPTRKRGGGVLSVLRREKPQQVNADGCDPAVFADQIKEYLERATTEREHHATALADAAEREREQAARAPREAPAETTPAPAAEAPLVFDETPQANAWGSEPEPSAWSAPARAPVEAARSAHEPPPIADDAPATVEAPAVEAVPVVAVVYDEPAADGSHHTAVLQAEPTVETAPPEPEPRAVVIHAEFPGPQSQSSKQAWPIDSGSSHAEDEVPGADEVLVEMTHQPEPPVVQPPPVSREAAAAHEANDDLEIFDLDIDALVNEPSREQPALDAAAPADGEAATRVELEEPTSDDVDLEVYDLDLSSLLGEGAREAAPVEEPPASAAAEARDTDKHTPAAATAKAPAATTHRDEDMDVYDLDLDLSLATAQLDEPPAAPLDNSSTPLPSSRPMEDARRRDAALESAPATRPSVAAKPEPPRVAEEPPARGSAVTKGAAEPRPKVDVRNPVTEARTLVVDVEPAGMGRLDVIDAGPSVVDEKPAVEARRQVVESTRPIVEDEPTRREIEEDSHHVIKSGVWAPLMTGAHRLWPRLEGGVAQQQPPPPPRLAVVGPSEAPVVAVLPPRTPAGPKRPEWLNVIKALKRDSQPISIAPAADTPTPSVEPTPPPRTEPAHVVAPAAPPVARTPAAEPDAVTAQSGQSRSKKRRLARKAKKEQTAQNPVTGDWGFFDPEDGGFSALVTRLDEITSSDQ